MGVTPQKDLGCEQRCAANYQRSGLQGWMVRASLKELSLGRSILHSSGREQSWLGVYQSEDWLRF